MWYDVRMNRWNKNVGNIGYDILLLLVGTSLLLERIGGWLFLYLSTIFVTAYSAISHILSLVRKEKDKEKTDIPIIVFSFFFIFIIVINPLLFIRFSIIFVGWWMFADGFFNLIKFHVKRCDQVSGAFSLLISGIISLIISFFLIFSNSLSSQTHVFSILAGIYFIVYGCIGLSYHIVVTSKWSTKQLRKKWSYSLPIVINAFIPLNVFISIKRLKRYSKLDISKEIEPSDLHVFVYLNESGPEAFGHIDIGYKGIIYSYGCHDPETRKLMGTYGDGVLIQSEEYAFVQNAIHGENKAIIQYGIKLNKQEKEILENRIKSFMDRTTPWLCAYAKAELENKNTHLIHDYASRVYKNTHAKMYKFVSGKYKTYFIAGTNCVNLADELIRNDELNLVDLNGLVTPGAYLAFLNTEYLKKNSIVTSRTLYESVL